MRGAAGAVEAANDEDDAGLRIRTLERRLNALERRARQEQQPDYDEVAQALREQAEAVARDLIDSAEYRLRERVAEQVHDVKSDTQLAVDRVARELREAVAREMRATEREVRVSVAETRAALERAFTPTQPAPYVRGRHYAAGSSVVHAGGAWLATAAMGTDEEPTTKAAGWVLQSDGVSGIASRLDDGALVVDVQLASGRSFSSRMAGAAMVHRGTWTEGRRYQPMEVVVRDFSTWVCVRATTADPLTSDGSSWVLCAARGARGPGPSEGRMAISERFLLGRMSEEGSNRERAAVALEEADDGWDLCPSPTLDDVAVYARTGLGGAVVALAGESARGAAENLADRVAQSAYAAARAENREDAVVRAQAAVRRAAVMVATPGRAEAFYDRLERQSRGDRVLRGALKALVGR